MYRMDLMGPASIIALSCICFAFGIILLTAIFIYYESSLVYQHSRILMSYSVTEAIAPATNCFDPRVET